MRRVLLRCGFAPGDAVMLTAAVRDLHRCYPGQFQVDVRTPYPDLWRHNPPLTPLNPAEPGVECLQCDYPLIQSANHTPCHFLHGFIDFINQKLGLQIRPTEFKGDIHLSAEERAKPSQVELLLGRKMPYWLIVGGGKFDLSIKWWESARWQAVVDQFRDRILFVQVGEARHFHPRLEGVLDLRGWTNLRQLIRLVYHAQGVLCPVTCLMHLAAAVETAPGQPKLRPCVVVAGGREPVHWEAYPGHQFIHTIGTLPCCANGGCWKRRHIAFGDGSANDQPIHLCSSLVGELPKCMDQITPAEVGRGIESYFENGMVRYLDTEEAKVARAAPGLARGIAIDEGAVFRPTARRRLNEFVTRIPAPHRSFAGRGIVMEASGLKYFGCAWVCLRMLRHLGCSLPIELWHRGDDDWPDRLGELLADYGVTPVDASSVLDHHPAEVSHPLR